MKEWLALNFIFKSIFQLQHYNKIAKFIVEINSEVMVYISNVVKI